MQAGSIARRYARALLDIVQESAVQESSLKESDKVAQTMTDLENFEILLKNNPELKFVLVSPLFSKKQRESILQEILSGQKCLDIVKRFLLFVASKGRFSQYFAIVREFRHFYDAQKNIIRVTLTSAVELNISTQAEIVGSIEKMTGKQVFLTKEIKPEILGGVVTRVGDLLLDGSIASQLTKMKQSLLVDNLNV